MPELPEVETIRLNIEAALIGRAVDSVALTLPKLLRDSPLPDLSVLMGRRVAGARRRAKVLVVDFDGELSLMAHLKLAGQVAILAADGRRLIAGHPVPDPNGTYPHKATHLTVVFDDGTLLYLSDVRRFGWLRLMPTPEVEPALEAFRFGPEGAGEGIGREELERRLARRRIPVKQALLNQAVLAGLGNIYVDEALHEARVHPMRPANGLRTEEIERLAAAIPWALGRGLEQGGAKIVNNRAVPRDGFPAVHGRAGERCPACGTAVVKIRVGGRGTYLCPSCQPEASGERRAASGESKDVGRRSIAE